MIVIGLVGRIGAGKSTVAAMFATLGAEVIDADRLAHEALGEPEVVAAVVARFGAGVLDAAGNVRRPALAERVFGPGPEHDANRRALEAIVHPRVRRRMDAALEACRQAERADGRRRVAVLDVPLLARSGWLEICDRIVIVECDEAVRRGRLAARGWSEPQREARDRAWESGSWPPRIPGKTPAVVDSSGDRAYTCRQVEGIWNDAVGR